MDKTKKYNQYNRVRDTEAKIAKLMHNLSIKEVRYVTSILESKINYNDPADCSFCGGLFKSASATELLKATLPATPYSKGKEIKVELCAKCYNDFHRDKRVYYDLLEKMYLLFDKWDPKAKNNKSLYAKGYLKALSSIEEIIWKKLEIPIEEDLKTLKDLKKETKDKELKSKYDIQIKKLESKLKKK